jgi:hypothetical protein
MIGVADISQISDECQPGCIEVRRSQEDIPARKKLRAEIIKLNEKTGTQALRKAAWIVLFIAAVMVISLYHARPLLATASTGLTGRPPKPN